jgi:hypothetical protein
VQVYCRTGFTVRSRHNRKLFFALRFVWCLLLSLCISKKYDVYNIDLACRKIVFYLHVRMWYFSLCSRISERQENAFSYRQEVTLKICRVLLKCLLSFFASQVSNQKWLPGQNIGVIRRKLWLTENNPKCRCLKKLTWRGLCDRCFICLRPPPLLWGRG